ncbi:MAG: hypothetical protein JNL08_04300 [Planctomycetes bacterium]|nr:hypothetical protein [Planctomycetota bacterium]
MDLPDPVLVLKGTLPPIVAALLLVGVGAARWLPLAMALGVAIAFSLLRNELPLLPHQLWSAPDGRHWLLWGLVAVALVAQLEHLRVLRGRFALGAGLAVAAAAVWFLLSKRAARWEPFELLTFVGSGAAVAALLVAVCRRIVARAPTNVTTAVLFTVVLSFDAVLLTVGRSGLFAQLCGAVAAALGAAAGTTLWRRTFGISLPDGTWLGAAHALLLLAGVHLGELSWGAFWFAALAPLPVLLLQPTLASRPLTWLLAALLLVLPLLGLGFWCAQG